jgi:hypothetical protein
LAGQTKARSHANLGIVVVRDLQRIVRTPTGIDRLRLAARQYRRWSMHDEQAH